MKNKPIKARKMWANYYKNCPVPDAHESKSRAMSWAMGDPATVTIPVAVIPLHNPYALGDAMVSALDAIGLLPRKGGRK